MFQIFFLPLVNVYRVAFYLSLPCGKEDEKKMWVTSCVIVKITVASAAYTTWKKETKINKI